MAWLLFGQREEREKGRGEEGGERKRGREGRERVRGGGMGRGESGREEGGMGGRGRGRVGRWEGEGGRGMGGKEGEARGQCWFREVMGSPPWEAQEGPEGQTTGLGVSESQRTAQVELGLVSRGWGVLSTEGGRATTQSVLPAPAHRLEIFRSGCRPHGAGRWCRPEQPLLLSSPRGSSRIEPSTAIS